MTYNEMKKASFCSTVLTVIAISAHAQLPELSARRYFPSPLLQRPSQDTSNIPST